MTNIRKCAWFLSDGFQKKISIIFFHFSLKMPILVHSYCIKHVTISPTFKGENGILEQTPLQSTCF